MAGKPGRSRRALLLPGCRESYLETKSFREEALPYLMFCECDLQGTVIANPGIQPVVIEEDEAPLCGSYSLS